MKKLSIFLWGIFFLFLIFKPAIAEQLGNESYQHAVSSCQNYLIDAGLENIQIQLAPHKTIWIRYENRRYRNEITALGIVLNYAAECFGFARQLVIVPLFRNTPIKFIRVNRPVFQQFIRNEISASEFMEQLKISFQPGAEKPLAGYGSQPVNSSLLNVDIIANPGVRAQFACPGDPAQLQFNFLSDISMTLATGLQLNGQWIFPLYNEFQNEEGRSRPGRIFLNQFIRCSSGTFLNISAGIFDLRCSGISTEVRHFLFHDRISISTRLDYLDTRSLTRLLPLNRASKNKLSYLFQAQYRFEPVNFLTKLTWGRFLLGDKRWRIDVVRQFHEIELGFMGVWNESLEFLTGMTVRLPFPVQRQPRPARVRIRTPRAIAWDYRYLPCYDGYILDTGHSFDRVVQQFSYSFIRANIRQFKSATRYVKLDGQNQAGQLYVQKGQR